jgi:hypothetical protein
MKLTGEFPFSKFQRRNIGQKGSNHMRCKKLLCIESTVCVNYISVVLLGNYAGTFSSKNIFLILVKLPEYSYENIGPE